MDLETVEVLLWEAAEKRTAKHAKKRKGNIDSFIRSSRKDFAFLCLPRRSLSGRPRRLASNFRFEFFSKLLDSISCLSLRISNLSRISRVEFRTSPIGELI